ncbi:MAG: S8 family peptidase [Pseudomonadota bacterium]
MVLIVLAGCGGGGGGGGGSSNLNLNGGPAPLSEPSIGASVAQWITSEYLAGGGLAYINAATGYSSRVSGSAGGSGVRVGIIDSGVRLDHTDLIVAENYVVAAGETNPTADDHGTHVAGIVGGMRNGFATHGVAYNSSIIGIQANAPVVNFLSPDTFTFEDLAYAIGSAAGVSKTYNGAARLTTTAAQSDVINMSLGGGATTAFVQEAMRDAAAQEKIMVIATGNDSLTQPDFPARDVIDAGVIGYGIAVGALNPADGSNTPAATFTNACGVTANYCLFAPGVSILSPTAGSPNEFSFFSGTSMAAPHVAGAAAALMAAFPTKTPTEIVDRLLTTAEDLGAVGVDAIYGRGALDLGAAMNPVGFLAIPSDRGPITLTGTGMSLGAAFGMPVGMEKLNSVLVYDEQDFPFFVDLVESVQVAERENAIESFLSASDKETVFVTAAPGESWSYSFAAEKPSDDTAGERALTGGQALDDTDGRVSGWRVGFDAGAGLSFTAASQVSHAGDTVSRQLTAQATDLALDSDAMLLPFAAIVGDGVGAGARYEVGGGLSFTGGYYAGDGLEDDADAGLAYIGFNQSLGDTGGLLSFSAGILDEEDRLLGSTFGGGFGEDTGATSRFVELGLTMPLTDKISLFGTASHGWSTVNETNNAFSSDWSTVRSSAYAVGARMTDLFGNDEITLTVGQPHRVDSASASLAVPVGDTVGGAILRSTERLDFSADGRETVVQAVYAKDVFEGTAQISGGVFGRFEPNHVADAEPEFGAAVRMTLRF